MSMPPDESMRDENSAGAADEAGGDDDTGPDDSLLEDDDPALLDAARHSLDDDGVIGGPVDVEATAISTAAEETAGEDAGAIDDSPDVPRTVPQRASEATHLGSDPLGASTRIAAELRRIEEDVRRMLDIVDAKRKRKLSGTRRWLELEEDLIAWCHSGRISDGDFVQLRQLIARRHHLFRQLSFLAGTRSTWNT
ncbi:MAG: hypothetical protein HY763_10675 [Planctomycetes bacterium]|nr:hypothetical protein [Planctomycetota bacterium]